MRRLDSPWWPVCASFGISLILLFIITWVLGPTRELDQDAPQYLSIGRNLADGAGYRDTWGPWGATSLTTGRMPAWPATIALALLLTPDSIPDTAVLRFANAVCLALAAGSFSFLAWQLGVRSPLLRVLAGLAVALSPAMIFISVSGMSEVLFALFVALSLNALLAGGSWIYVSAVCTGLASLVRTNFLIAPVALLILVVLVPKFRRLLPVPPRALLVMTAIALLPISLWTLRNYQVSGRFPLMSSLEGEALWGSNNPVSAGDLEHWGTWVFPDQIPSETPKLELAKTLSEIEVSEYYHREASAWVRGHLPDLPRLILGKLVRAFVPLPWNPLAASYVAFGYRFLLGLLLAWTARRWWPRAIGSPVNPYLAGMLAIFASLLATTLLYYGNFRFTHCMLEIFFTPLIALGLDRMNAFSAADDIVRRGTA